MKSYTIGILTILYSLSSWSQDINDTFTTDYSEVVIIAERVQKTNVFNTLDKSKYRLGYLYINNSQFQPFPSCVTFQYLGHQSIIIDSITIRGQNLSQDNVLLNLDIYSKNRRYSTTELTTMKSKRNYYNLYPQQDIIIDKAGLYYIGFSFKHTGDKGFSIYTDNESPSQYISYSAEKDEFKLLTGLDNSKTVIGMKIYYREIPKLVEEE